MQKAHFPVLPCVPVFCPPLLTLQSDLLFTRGLLRRTLSALLTVTRGVRLHVSLHAIVLYVNDNQQNLFAGAARPVRIQHTARTAAYQHNFRLHVYGLLLFLWCFLRGFLFPGWFSLSVARQFQFFLFRLVASQSGWKDKILWVFATPTSFIFILRKIDEV